MEERGGYGSLAGPQRLPFGAARRTELSFTGEFRHTIDAKGRLIVPSRLRDELTDDRVVLTKWMDGCIAMWSSEGWAEFEARLRQQDRTDPAARATVRTITSSAHPDEVDKQGRIGMPANLREHAAVTRDVVVIGALDHGEIWNPKRWEEQQAKVEGSGLEELARTLNF